MVLAADGSCGVPYWRLCVSVGLQLVPWELWKPLQCKCCILSPSGPPTYTVSFTLSLLSSQQGQNGLWSFGFRKVALGKRIPVFYHETCIDPSPDPIPQSQHLSGSESLCSTALAWVCCAMENTDEGSHSWDACVPYHGLLVYLCNFRMLLNRF